MVDISYAVILYLVIVYYWHWNFFQLQSVSDNDVRDIVLSYLMHNCFKETAETFLSSTGLNVPIDYTVDVDKRKGIYLWVNT